MPTTRTTPLEIVRDRLADRSPRRPRKVYHVPALWTTWGFTEGESAGRGQVRVDPYRLLLQCLDEVILPAAAQPVEAAADEVAARPSRRRRRASRRSLSRQLGIEDLGGGRVRVGDRGRRGGDWIRESTLYSMLVRTSTAWDHDGTGSLTGGRWTKTGTFLKSILLLPILAEMGVDVVYLLPVTRCSRRYRKGELGCPYAAQSFFELEPDLHDRLLGPEESEIELEFAAFVDAAHALDMRVMIDLAPRTTARDSDLLLEHPDWFYWIKTQAEKTFRAPPVDGFDKPMPEPAELADILTQPSLREHVKLFQLAPNQLDPKGWRAFVRACKEEPPRDVLREINRRFKLTTAPGFSDCLNDTQPPWSDITFLRLYLDHPAASVKHLEDPEHQPPYAFTDTIKASLFPGHKPNQPLWKLLARILPWYQQFGVDGARVDMGHALPPALQDLIIGEARKKDPDFSLLAEEFNHAYAARWKRTGYNAIIGSASFMEPRAADGEFHQLVTEMLPSTVLPAWAAAELPDSPRAAVREGGRTFSRLVAVLNYLLPNSLPLINSGLELYERQPMNLGLDNVPPGRFALSKRDPYYGKLAFFDRVALHWTNQGAADLIELMSRAAELRRRFLSTLSKPKRASFPPVTRNAKHILAIAWQVRANRESLLVLANLDCEKPHSTQVGPIDGLKRPTHVEELPVMELGSPRNRRGSAVRLRGNAISAQLEPGEVKLVLVR
jgi:starch synthase (maltosyl-transferring)